MLVDRVRAFAARHDLWRPGTRVIVALSGGADSVSLLLLLHELHGAGDLVLDSAVHVNHQLRGDESAADEAFCRNLCARVGVDYSSTTVDVRPESRRARVSVEVAARRARQAVFAGVLAARGADLVATAHTENDQAETVLLRIVRGAGGRGLGGIRPRRARLVRPLLEVGRQELRDWLTGRGQNWREDASNAEYSTPRNRIRAELIPYLSTHFNPAVTRALARLADVAREEDTVLEHWVGDLAAGVMTCAEDRVVLTVTAFADLPHGLARRLARRALEMANPGRFYAVREVDRLLAVVAGRQRAAEISGLRAERFRGLTVLLRRAPVGPPRRRGTPV